MPLVPLLALALITAGCAGPSIRSQSPEMAALMELDADVKLVGDYATAWGVLPQRVEAAARNQPAQHWQRPTAEPPADGTDERHPGPQRC